MLAFLAARYLLRDKIRSLLIRRPKYRKLDRAVADDGWQVVVLMRLSPIVPFNLQNYALGVTAIPFLQYLTATLIGIAPGIAIYVYFGIFGKGWGMLFWSRATRDLLRSFGWGIAALHRLHAATKLPSLAARPIASIGSQLR